MLDQIQALKVRRGVSLKPATALSTIEKELPSVDMVLLMTVNPGFGGQSFMPEVLPKIAELRRRFSGDIEVDGGINGQTAPQVLRAGANVLVAGTAIFGQADAQKAIHELRGQG